MKETKKEVRERKGRGECPPLFSNSVPIDFPFLKRFFVPNGHPLFSHGHVCCGGVENHRVRSRSGNRCCSLISWDKRCRGLKGGFRFNPVENLSDRREMLVTCGRLRRLGCSGTPEVKDLVAMLWCITGPNPVIWYTPISGSTNTRPMRSAPFFFQFRARRIFFFPGEVSVG
jgi:hypothetical protein